MRTPVSTAEWPQAGELNLDAMGFE
jgi:hypothetical protein